MAASGVGAVNGRLVDVVQIDVKIGEPENFEICGEAGLGI